jgi:hypothetical protein
MYEAYSRQNAVAAEIGEGGINRLKLHLFLALRIKYYYNA